MKSGKSDHRKIFSEGEERINSDKSDPTPNLAQGMQNLAILKGQMRD